MLWRSLDRVPRVGRKLRTVRSNMQNLRRERTQGIDFRSGRYRGGVFTLHVG
jgi:hypothetical protein